MSYASTISVLSFLAALFHVIIGVIQKGFLYLICHALLQTCCANIMKTFLGFWKGKHLSVSSETKSKGNKQPKHKLLQ